MLNCLEEMSVSEAGSKPSARASGLHTQLCKGSTLLEFKIALKVFGPLETLNRSLQARYQTVSGMLTAIGETISGLRDLRQDEMFDQLLSDTETVVKELNLEKLQVQRQRKPPGRYTGDAVAYVATTVAE